MVETKKREISLSKKLIFEELEKEFSSSSNSFFSRFDRLSVQDMNELRRNLEKVSKRTLLVKHTLAKKMLEKANLKEAVQFLDGAVLMTLGVKDPQMASKTLVDFMKGRENMEVKGMILDGKIYEASFVKEMAKLPSRKDLLGMVAIRMKSPITAMVMTLSGLIQSWVRVLNEVQKKRAQEAPQQA